eukprot:2567160-Rhodomonas_salina.1
MSGSVIAQQLGTQKHSAPAAAASAVALVMEEFPSSVLAFFCSTLGAQSPVVTAAHQTECDQTECRQTAAHSRRNVDASDGL